MLRSLPARPPLSAATPPARRLGQVVGRRRPAPTVAIRGRVQRVSSRFVPGASPTRERAIAALRGGFALTLLAATVVDPPARAWVAYLTIAALLAVSALVLRQPPTSRLLARPAAPVVLFLLDALGASAIGGAYPSPDALSWVPFIPLLLSGAARWSLNGSVLGFAIFLAADMASDLDTLHAGDPAVSALLAIRIGVMGLAAVIVGLVARSFAQFRALQARTVALETRARAVRAFAESDSLSGGIEQFLQATCETMGWVGGQMWSLDARGTALVLETGWYSPEMDGAGFEALNREVSFARGEGLPGRAWEQDVPVTMRMDSTPVVLRRTACAHAGLVMGVAFPVVSDAGTTGVIEYFSRSLISFDDDLRTLLADMGAQAGMFVDRRREETAHRETAIRLRALLDSVVDGIVTFDELGVIETANHAAAALFGCARADLTATHVDALLSPEHSGEITSRIAQGVLEWETEALRRDGTTFPMEFRAGEMRLDGARLFIGTLRDTSERHAQTRALQHQALHDNLTGLPNRTLLTDRLDLAIAGTTRSQQPFALLLMDMDGFKEVNDTLGHQCGDALLRQVSERLRDALRADDTVARLGGDEFAILPAGPCDEAGAQAIADKVLEAMQAPFLVDEQSIHARMSVGIAVHPIHGRDTETLMRRADVAMYTAKRSRTGSAAYSPTQDEHSKRRLQLTGELRRAIPGNELTLHYQPRMDISSGAITSLEALVRWQHPSQGLLGPSEFVPVAEQSDLIHPLTAWVAGEAVRQLRAFREMGLETSVAINLSARDLENHELPDQIAELLRTWGVPPRLLRLEMTETVIMGNGWQDVLGRLHDLGLSLSIDDFGVGYSSLAYLQRLPVDEIKIDKSFVGDIVENSDNAAIVRSTIELGHNLGLRVVAEGVESQSCLEMLESFGCDAAQGYLISPPCSAVELIDLLLDRAA